MSKNTDKKIKPGKEQLEEVRSHNFTKEFNEGKFTKGETFTFSRAQFKRWFTGDMTTSELDNCRYKPKEENEKG